MVFTTTSRLPTISSTRIAARCRPLLRSSTGIWRNGVAVSTSPSSGSSERSG
jgi:hypothetical protein